MSVLWKSRRPRRASTRVAHTLLSMHAAAALGAGVVAYIAGDPLHAADGLGRGNILSSWSVDLGKKILLDRGQ